MRWIAFIAVLGCMSACNTFDPKHPLVGKPSDFRDAPAIYIWIEDENIWHIRLLARGGPHRFQGSVAGVHGGVLDLTLTRGELKDSIALSGDAVQFDVETSTALITNDGFDMRVAGGCAHFDLYVDGRHHADKVRLGPRLTKPSKIPFDRCP
jgi:hypothetical protein